MLLLSAFIIWFQFALRRTGLEVWGDGAAILYLGAATYPASLLLLLIGSFWVSWVRRKAQESVPVLARVMFIASVVALVLPWFLLVMLYAD
jgi:small-conductance mechanosensitive channel